MAQMLALLMSFKIPSRSHVLHAAALACGPWRAPLRHGHGHGHDFQMMPGTDGRWPMAAWAARQGKPYAAVGITRRAIRPCGLPPDVRLGPAPGGDLAGDGVPTGAIRIALGRDDGGFGVALVGGQARWLWGPGGAGQSPRVRPVASAKTIPCVHGQPTGKGTVRTPVLDATPASCVRLARGLPNDAPGWAGVGAACHPQALWRFMGR